MARRVLRILRFLTPFPFERATRRVRMRRTSGRAASDFEVPQPTFFLVPDRPRVAPPGAPSSSPLFPGRNMKDSSVAPAGLFSPERQRRLIDALIARFSTCQTATAGVDQPARSGARRGRESTAFGSKWRHRRLSPATPRSHSANGMRPRTGVLHSTNTIRFGCEPNSIGSLRSTERRTPKGRLAIDRNRSSTRGGSATVRITKHQPGEQSKKEIDVKSTPPSGPSPRTFPGRAN